MTIPVRKSQTDEQARRTLNVRFFGEKLKYVKTVNDYENKTETWSESAKFAGEVGSVSIFVLSIIQVALVNVTNQDTAQKIATWITLASTVIPILIGLWTVVVGISVAETAETNKRLLAYKTDASDDSIWEPQPSVPDNGCCCC